VPAFALAFVLMGLLGFAGRRVPALGTE
jgi:hypothetical protein